MPLFSVTSLALCISILDIELFVFVIEMLLLVPASITMVRATIELLTVMPPVLVTSNVEMSFAPPTAPVKLTAPVPAVMVSD